MGKWFSVCDLCFSHLTNVLVFSFVLLFSTLVHIQGFNLLDDGLWVLGARDILNGKVLYSDLFTIYGPNRFYLLASLFRVFGERAFALALLKAVSDGVAASLLFSVFRRNGKKWLAPLGVLGIVAISPVSPRYVAALAFTLFLVSKRIDWQNGKVLCAIGMGWAVVSLFGLDMFVYGLMAVLGFLARVIFEEDSWRLFCRQARALLLGFIFVMVPVWGVAVFGGYSDTAFWDTIVYPLTRFKSGVGLGIGDAFKGAGSENGLFYGFLTGEIHEPAWPWHLAIRGFSIKSLYLYVLVTPLIGIWVTWKSRSWRLLPLILLALAGLSTVGIRTDEAHLKAALLSVMALQSFLVLSADNRKKILFPVAGVFALALVPLAAEKVYMVVHLKRDGIARWERETAGVYLTPERIALLDRVLQETGWDENSPAIAWPIQPGLVFLSGASLGTRQTTLLPGEVRDIEPIILELEKARSESLVVGPAKGVVPGVRTMGEIAPEIWSLLRKTHFVESHIGGSSDEFQVLKRFEGSQKEFLELPLKNRLPLSGQYVRSSMSPTLDANTVISQTFTMDGNDLSGMSLLLVTPPPYPVDISFHLRISSVKDGGVEDLLWDGILRSRISRNSEISHFSLGPVAGTAGSPLNISVRNDPQCQQPLRLLWDINQDHNDDKFDRFPNGEARMNNKLVNGDLFFVVW